MSVGRCKACGIPGQGEKPFVCDDCLNLKGGMAVCRACKWRAKIAIGDMMQVEDRYAFPIPLQCGVVIVLDHCPSCVTSGFAPQEVSVLAVRLAPAN